MIKIKPNEFKVITKYIHEICGISLETGKEYLIETRLGPLVDQMGLTSYSELYSKAKLDPQKNLDKKIVDAISTNETYFFRDNSPFELLQHKLLPDLIDKRETMKRGTLPTQLRIWSAACSTGQEVYSIGIVLTELLMDTTKYRIRLLGTDISNAAIAQASYGRYNKFEIARGLSTAKLNKYFRPDGEHWRIKDEIRALAMFRKLNLMEPLVGMGKFDIILCRNVAIYFTPQDRKRLYEQIAGVLEPDGYLVIGSTESLANDTNLFAPQKYLRSIFYQLRNQ